MNLWKKYARIRKTPASNNLVARRVNAVYYGQTSCHSHFVLHFMAALDEQLVERCVYLMRFARLQLRNDAWAEDAVSETMLAALSKPQTFSNRSQLKTWLVGVLKYTVIDMIRLNSREMALPDSDTGNDSDELDKLAFQADGHFVEPPNAWGDPRKTLQQNQFFQVLDICMERLPLALGLIFLMREWLELSCDEVCKELSVTPTNLYVQLHRARLRDF